ncbi:MAG: class I SAM-dependent methyltransferase [Porticoccaceae bacterium]
MQATINAHHYIEYLGVKALKSTHPEIRKIKRKQQGHSAHGNKNWRSSFVLMDYLSTYPPKSACQVLDIGCGWGLSAIYMAKRFQAQVTGIDIDDSVVPYLSLQAELNNCDIQFQKRSFESFKTAELTHYDYLIGADICFWDEMALPLLNLITRARKGGVNTILIADPGRPPFWELVDLCARKFNSDVVTRRLEAPWRTEKYILVI